MRAILISKPPKQVANILKGEQTIIVLMTAPKEWVDYLSGKTKEKPKPMTANIYCVKRGVKIARGSLFGKLKPLNGRVVAKFTLREVERLLSASQDTYCGDYDEVFFTKTVSPYEFLNASRMSQEELSDYGGRYACHISDLVIFDKPMELEAFLKPNWDKGLDKALKRAQKEDEKVSERIYNGDACEDEIANCEELTLLGFELSGVVKRAPYSWCYVEERNDGKDVR